MRFVASRVTFLLCASALFAAGCGKNDPGSCANVSCDGVCCEAGQVCTDGVCAAPSCTPESREAFCTRMAQAGKVCGRIAGKDNCDADRTEECGTSACTADQACAAATNTCVACVMETKAAFCERQAEAGKVCGTITDKDAHCTAKDHTEDCGTTACASGTCNADNTCVGCTKETKTAFCAREATAGKVCGSITAKDANCANEDHTEDCGTASCPSNACKTDNTCQACTNETKDAFCARQATAGKVCGSITVKDLNCPNSDHTEDCGLDACPSGSCQNDNTCVGCTMETKDVFCTRMADTGKVCGSITAKDANCHAADHTEDCGTAACPSATCQTDNTCLGCTLETKNVFCARQATAGKVCGSITAKDASCPNSDHTEDCGIASCPSASCEAATNTCTPCTMETNAAFCARQALTGLVCGSITAKDAHCIAIDHTENCGQSACQSYEFCDSASHCACTSEAVNDFCSRMATAGKVCGSITGDDNCQRTRSESCGTAACGAQEACNPSNNHCECAPESAAAFCSSMALVGKVCGPITGTDNCGNASRTENCGTLACVEPTLSCDTVTNHCVCVPEAPAAFCARMAQAGKVCGSVTGADNCNATRTEDCGVAACTNGQLCAVATNTCYIPNDTCTAPETLTFSGTPATATATADTTLAVNNYAGSCAAMTGGDLVYAFSVPAGGPKRVIAKVTATNSTYAPAVYIRSANCASSATADELACSAGRTGFQAVATIASLAPGNYHLIVDGAAGSQGAFTLTVVLGALLNDDCTSPAAELDTRGLDSNYDGTIVLHPDNTTATNNGQGTCFPTTSTAGADLVWAFDIPAGMTKNVVATMVFNPAGSRWPNVYFRRNCSSALPADELGCAYSTSASPQTAVAKVLPAGRYYLWADAWSSDVGPFDLTVVFSTPGPTPTNDTCGTAGANVVALALDAAPVAGDTSGATADYGGAMSSSVGSTCYSAFSSAAAVGSDAVYSYTPSASGDFWVELVPSGWTAALWYTTNGTCGDTGASCINAKKGSAVGAAVDMKITGVAGTTYHIYVDALATTAFGPYTIAIKSPPTNVNCTGTVVALAYNAAPIISSTNMSTANYGGGLSSSVGAACYNDLGSASASGPDMVYSYTPTSDGDFYAELVPFGWIGALWYSVGTCGGNGTDCVHARLAASAGATTDLRIPGVAGSTYYLYVDSTSSSTAGAYSIAIRPAPALPNNVCGTTAGANAIALSLNAPVTGSTAGATADDGRAMSSSSGAACYTALGSSAALGQDLVYSFTPAADGDVWVDLVPTGWIGALWYTTNTCGDTGANCVAAKKGASAGAAVDLKIPAMANTTYFVYVDSTSISASGPFTLVVMPGPSNDVCTGAVALTMNGAPVTGNTGMAAADYGGTMTSGQLCYIDLSSSGASGPELVYTYTPASDGDFYAELVPNNWSGVLWYNVGTCGGTGSDCVHARKSASSGSTVDLRIQGVAGSTYYIYVDSTSTTTAGSFTIAIKPAPSIPNDVCGTAGVRAIALTLDAAALSGDTTDATADYGQGLASGVGGTCYTALGSSAASGPELAYSFTPSANGDFWIQVVPTGWIASVWYTSASCGDNGAGCVAAKKSASTGATVDLKLTGTAGTTYFIYVDSTSLTTAGPFTIAAKTFPTNDQCSGAIALSMNGSPLAGNIAPATNDYGGSISSSSGGGICWADVSSYAASGPELVYSYTPSADGDFHVEVVPTGWNAYVWYNVGTCGGNGSDCVHAKRSPSPGNTVDLRIPGVAGTTYYLYVDGASTFGPFTIALKPAPALPNDLCGAAGAGAIALTLDAAPIAGDTSDATADDGRGMTSTSGGTCYTALGSSAASGPELVYRFTPAANGDYWVQLVPNGWIAALWYTTGTCGDTGANCTGAKKSSASGAQIDLKLTGVAGTTYYLYVDSTAIGTFGPFTLAVKSMPVNDVCGAGVVPLALNATPVASSTGLAVADYGASISSTVGAICYADATSNSSAGPELVYAYTPAADGDFFAELIPNGWTAQLWYTTGTCGGNGADCVHAKRGSSTLDLRIPGVAGTTYYLYVDSSSTSTSGPFTIAVKPAPALPNDLCGANGASAVALALDAAPVSASTSDANADYGAFASGQTCYSDLSSSAASGPEVVYKYTASADATFTVEVAPTGWTAAVWYTTGTCGGAASTCVHAKKGGSSGATVGLAIPGTVGTTYFIYVDSTSISTNGPFTIALKSAPVNDRCGVAATPLAFNAAPVAGNTVYAGADDGGSFASGQACYIDLSSSAAAGPDAVYSYTAAADGDFYAELVPTGWSGALWYSVGSCAATATDCVHAKKSASSGATVDLRVPGVAGTTYYVYVDSTSSSTSGPYTIAIKPAPALPNDICGANGAKAVALALDAAPVSFSTADATADYGMGFASGQACYSDLSSSAALGPDLVYSYTATANQGFTVEVVPTGWTASVWYTTGICGGAATDCVHAKKGGSSGATVSLLIPAMAGTSYYIYVDSTSISTSGPFTIALKSAPANDRCGLAAIPLALNAVANGTTLLAGADDGAFASGTACYTDISSSAAPGPDLVYSFTAAQTQDIEVVLLPGGWTGVIWYTAGSCGDATASNCVHARKGPGDGRPVSLRIPGVSGTTYYLYVDSASATTSGAYSIAVVTPMQLSNDTCGALGANATALTLDAPPVFGDTADAIGDYGATLSSACNTSLGGNAPGPEVVYSYTPTASGNFFVDVNPYVDISWDSSNWIPFVWVTANDCGNGSACTAAKKAVATGSAVGLLVNGTAATTYFIHVDGAAATLGLFTIGIKSPPTNDTCGVAGANATVLQLDAAPVAGNLGLAAVDYGATMASGQTCYTDLSSTAAPGPDLVYAYTPAAAGDFWVELVPFGWTGAIWYTLNTCGDPGPACVHAKKGASKNGPVDLKITGVAGSTYYIYVDQTSTTTAVGNFTIAIKSPPPNDLCAGIIPLTLNAAPVVGSTTMAAADFGGSIASGSACYSDMGSNGAAGTELVYSYTPTSSGDFKVEMVPQGWNSNYNALWYNLGTCGGTGSDCVHAHKSGLSGQKAVLKIAGVANTTYFIYADSTSTTASNGGLFTIDVKPVSVPTNDTCGANGVNAIELYLDAAPTTGDLTDATADYACAGSAPYVSNGSPGKDVVFKYTPARNGIFFVRMECDRFDAVIWYSTSCDSTSGATCAGFADTYAASGPDTVAINGVAGTTYYLFADDYTSGSVGGSFTIAVKSAAVLPY